ncbi:MAG TPA: nicotinate phosphoribosyltransferase, partial [Buchnera sp. (in: enterobacteria)]|nr:nicotinate phosphoribosyltransferase [Buchnera sp. (in: enterobacteria)]
MTKKFNDPILKTLLDTDAYKFHMQQAIFYYYPNITVSAEFICRGNDKLGSYKQDLIKQIKMMQALYLSDEEYLYMSSFSFFKRKYLNWLKNFRYNIDQVIIKDQNGYLYIHISGLWKEVILWEVPILALISELVHRTRSPNINSKIAIDYLNKKLINFYTITEDLDLSLLKLIDFGTRRRFSYDVHFNIIKTLKNKIPYLVGSSNYHIARILGIPPIGTQAHEWFQAHQQISSVLSQSQRLALQVWLNQYKHELSIALTDSINMDAFLKDFGIKFATDYQGMRHDSGNPIKWGEKAIDHYKSLGINPLKKTLLFSDNLDFKKIVSLYLYFRKKINVVFGIGTKLTCDIPKIKPLNIVIKLIECNGKPVAKLSDSPGKTIGLDKKFVYKL